jgi:P4 family phage/plasmid primase-like protien
VSAQRGPRESWQVLAFWDEASGAMHPGATLAGLPRDDLAASRVITQECWPGDLLHVPGPPGTWYVWEGRYYRADDNGSAERRILVFAGWFEQVIGEARQAVMTELESQPAWPGLSEQAKDQRRKAAWAPWEKTAAYAAGLRRSAGASSLGKVLSSVCGISSEEMTDRWPGHLNVANGILELATGQLWPHARQARMTYCLEAAWNPDATCPLFSSLLWRAAGEVPAVYETLADALGYCIGGHNDLQRVFFLNGPAASGKTRLLEVVSTVLGPLAHQGDVALFAHHRERRNAREEHSVRGARLVAIAEASNRVNIEEAQLKRLTGQAEISTNEHYKAVKNRTRVTWVIIMATNEMPSVLKLDGGLRRRIIVIPMGPSIPPSEQDTRIGEKITAAEKDGVLALLVSAYQRAMCHQFADLPPEVTQETEHWITDQDTIETWLGECAQLAPDGWWSLNGQAPKEQPADLWDSYNRFHGPVPHYNRLEFFRELEGRHGIARSTDKRYFMGLELLAATWERS